LYLLGQLGNKEFPWEATFVLLNWLSLILLMPFDLHILDSKLAGAFSEKLFITKDASIVEVIVALCKQYLASTSVTANAACECLGKLFSRKDIREKDYMVQFFDWTLGQIEANKDDQFQSFYQTGLHAGLDQIFKLLAREDLLKIIPKVYKTLFHEDPYKENYLVGVGTVRLNRTKLAQRMALTLLRPRECRWMHRRTKKSLLKNFQGQLDTSLIQTNVAAVETRNKGEEKTANELEEDGIDEDVDLETLEGLLGIIFDSLKDKETTVRWSAAP
jgi:tubulin-specific chaperone D